ncbi:MULTISPECIES: DoxX family protein [unclassified Celeribacter]|uniref:DoxX family protein n=1 Tax=unclassified Celeribacter TaxID=2618893 RepID=UPI001C6697A2|nr:DoxX family protein [Celeribacter sp. PS-C1]MBW6419718.1 DoxX family protein [Celeribacter sp. PS-C1]
MIDLSSNLLSFAGAGSVTAIALAALLLRVSLGGLFLAHAYLKYFIFTPKGAAGFFASLGVPGWFAYITIAAETLGGIALIVGFQTSLVALLLIPTLLGAAILAHGKNGFWFTNENGGWEYPAFWAVALFVQVLLGGGALALTH